MKFYESDVIRLQNLINTEISRIEKILKIATNEADEKVTEEAENEIIELEDLRARIKYIV